MAATPRHPIAAVAEHHIPKNIPWQMVEKRCHQLNTRSSHAILERKNTYRCIYIYIAHINYTNYIYMHLSKHKEALIEALFQAL